MNELEQALLWRQRRAMTVVAELEPAERVLLLAEVIAPSHEVLERSLVAVREAARDRRNRLETSTFGRAAT